MPVAEPAGLTEAHGGWGDVRERTVGCRGLVRRGEVFIYAVRFARRMKTFMLEKSRMLPL
ncbi:hypothetical protein Stsp02_30470 [Streptomyces sp. NBRC 14336]|nr:hypothetical protein Stsp02_30470 [Streptomyces sp. NBRC 14336]